MKEPMTGSPSRATSELMKLFGLPANPDAKVGGLSLDPSTSPPSAAPLRVTEVLAASVEGSDGD